MRLDRALLAFLLAVITLLVFGCGSDKQAVPRLPAGGLIVLDRSIGGVALGADARTSNAD